METIAALPDERDCIVTCRNVSKAFRGVPALSNISCTIRKGETVCVVGPSGGGKSTFLRTLNALEPIDAGAIVVSGITLPGTKAQVDQLRREVGMVFQSFNLFPHMTVRRNITLAPVRTGRMSRRQADARAEQLLARVGISDQIEKYPSQLSGGQQQRVAIARALAMEPSLLLFDEPTSALDPEMVNEVLDVIRELSGSGITMIVVTHEMGFAREIADRVFFMVDGGIGFAAPPSRFFNQPDDRRVAAFLSKVL